MNNLNDITNTYYEYISKVSQGCVVIANLFRETQINEGISNLLNFIEGFEGLVKIEQFMTENGYFINSRLAEANEFLNEITEALEVQDYTLIADLFEYEIVPLFSSASEWIFIKNK